MTAPNYNIPIVDGEGKQTQEFNTWALRVERDILLIGTGSPEGVVEATVGQQYMDNAGVAGSILYVKRDPDIGGDTSQGWILV